MDKSTKDRIAKMKAKVSEEMKTIVDECNIALSGRSQIRLSQGLRTFAEQDALYKQKPKVTNAKAGQSIHNYGFAVDMVLIIDGKTASWDIHKDWDNDKVSDWDECVKIFAKHGWSWGGSWASFKDFPHFEKIGFNNWRTLLFKDKDLEGYVIV